MSFKEEYDALVENIMTRRREILANFDMSKKGGILDGEPPELRQLHREMVAEIKKLREKYPNEKLTE